MPAPGDVADMEPPLSRPNTLRQRLQTVEIFGGLTIASYHHASVPFVLLIAF
ncbi:hypothetical protein AB0M12_12300 [Nocardia vinacea]|uniref:hypothetical protein n=1 Tax=Nocardia vinacea TaxID=96468 RepID=UPI00341C6EA9